jgi:hypothetical protein
MCLILAALEVKTAERLWLSAEWVRSRFPSVFCPPYLMPVPLIRRVVVRAQMAFPNVQIIITKGASMPNKLNKTLYTGGVAGQQNHFQHYITVLVIDARNDASSGPSIIGTAIPGRSQKNHP